MTVSLRPALLGRYRDLAWLLFKYGRSDLVKAAGLEDALSSREAPEVSGADAANLAADLEALGPTFIKLGQLLSTRPDLLPPPYLAALSRLQDRVEPFPFADVERIVTTELGVRMSKAFAEFEAVPMAAASLGQVHRARLRDGRLVAVKVQRPDIRERVVEDLEALEGLAELLQRTTELGERYQLAMMVAEFRRTLLRELDYLLEARNLLTLRQNLAAFDRLVVPAPVDDYTTSRVLTMDYVPGVKVTTVSPVALLDVDGALLAEQLFRAYLKQVLVDGVFHADPHPGNVLLTPDGRLALLDLGMVAHVTARIQDQLLQLILAASEGRAEEVVAAAIKLGQRREAFDERELLRAVTQLVARNKDAPLENVAVGQTVLELARVAADAGLRLPPELSMLGKTLLNLDAIARALSPATNPTALVRQHAAAIFQQRLLGSLSPGNALSGLLEAKDLVARLPERLNRILDRLAGDRLEVKVDAIDEVRLMVGLQKIANRITLGLLLAALIVGAALLMSVETSFRLLGYPGLAIVLFLLAAAGAVALAFSILFKDV